jgi:ABC-type Zn2+ transport system substrate-binding protein/surface adhesin
MSKDDKENTEFAELQAKVAELETELKIVKAIQEHDAHRHDHCHGHYCHHTWYPYVYSQPATTWQVTTTNAGAGSYQLSAGGSS